MDHDPPPNPAPGGAHTASDPLAAWLVAFGVRWVFAVRGEGIEPLWTALSGITDLSLVACQNEAGAAYCASEASLATEAPVAVLLADPSALERAHPGLCAARREGARVIVLSGRPFAGSALCAAADLDVSVHDSGALPGLLQRIELGRGRDSGFVAHLALSSPVLRERAELVRTPVQVHRAEPDPRVLADLARRLRSRRCALVAGFGARGCHREVRALAEALSAPVLVTAHAKGVFPDGHPLHAGVLGIDGALRTRPETLLLIGSPHIDADAGILQGCDVVAVPAELPAGTLQPRALDLVSGSVRSVVTGLLDRLPRGREAEIEVRSLPLPAPSRRISHAALMASVQRVCVERSAARLMAGPGPAADLAVRHLSLGTPRLRVGTGPLGTGAVGAALATGSRVVALVGDGGMHEQELLTAARHGAATTWLVMNETVHPSVDYAAWAEAQGVPGRTLWSDLDLDDALRNTLEGGGPRLLDLRMDPDGRAALSAAS
ncbi:MAG: thiamine pyrophosphate-binding protein [Myxococcota bacterium]